MYTENIVRNFAGTPTIDTLGLKALYTIPGFSRYRVTMYGNVWDTRSERWIKASKISAGYLVLSLVSDAGRRKTLYAHRLVGLALNGEPQPCQTDCAHNDGTRDNNFFVNLRWATRSENLADRATHGTMPLRIPLAPRASLTKNDVWDIRLAYKNGERQSDIARRYNVTTPNINHIVKRKTWAHI